MNTHLLKCLLILTLLMPGCFGDDGGDADSGPNCVVGKRCGDTCISVEDTCHIGNDGAPSPSGGGGSSPAPAPHNVTVVIGGETPARGTKPRGKQPKDTYRYVTVLGNRAATRICGVSFECKNGKEGSAVSAVLCSDRQCSESEHEVNPLHVRQDDDCSQGVVVGPHEALILDMDTPQENLMPGGLLDALSLSGTEVRTPQKRAHTMSTYVQIPRAKTAILVGSETLWGGFNLISLL